MNVSHQSRKSKRGILYGIMAVTLMLLAPVVMLFDLPLSRTLTAEKLPGDIEKSILLCEFFAHGFGVAVILVATFILAPTLRRKLPRVAACAVASGCLANFLKGVVARARPLRQPVPDEIQNTFMGWLPLFNQKAEFDYLVQSFPSAHTATAFGLAVGMSWLVPQGKWLFFSCAVLAALQRVVSQAHWPSDTLVGAGIATAVSAAIIHAKYPNRMFEWWENRKTAQSTDLKRGLNSRESSSSAA